MIRLLIFLCLVPSFALADKWTKTTRKDKMYDYVYDVISNSDNTVAVRCVEEQVDILIDYGKFIGISDVGDFIFRFDSNDPIEWHVQDVNGAVMTHSDAQYIVDGLAKHKKLVTRISSEYVFAEKTIDATGFAAAYNSSKECRKSVDDWKLKNEQPGEDANFQLVAETNDSLWFVDRDFFQETEKSVWVLVYAEEFDGEENELSAPGFLTKVKFDCNIRSTKRLHSSIYNEEGEFIAGSSDKENIIKVKSGTASESILEYACNNSVYKPFAEIQAFSSVKSALDFARSYEAPPYIETETEEAEKIWDANGKCVKLETSPIPIGKFSTKIAYPAKALEEDIEGEATITSEIDANGDVISSSISATDPVFNSVPVIAEAKRQKYKPATSKCDNVSGTYTYTVPFKLK